MKAGTTTLCTDLSSHPEIYFPPVKEPHTLMTDQILSDNGVRKYAQLFKKARPNQLAGEGSTGYTKFPWSKGVPEKARNILGKDLKLIYIVREPIERAMSHHYHLFRAGKRASALFEEAIERNPDIIRCSLYGMQIKPWLDVFDRENFLIVKFEDFIISRNSVLSNIFKFLDCRNVTFVADTSIILNVGKSQKILPEGIAKVKGSLTRKQWYKRNIAPILPIKIKNFVKNMMYKPFDDKCERPNLNSITMLLDKLQADSYLQIKVMKAKHPLYNIEELRKKYLKQN